MELNNAATAILIGQGLTPQQCAARLRPVHAELAWAGELNYPNYAALHYAGLAAIERLALGSNTYELVPVQHGVYVVT